MSRLGQGELGDSRSPHPSCFEAEQHLTLACSCRLITPPRAGSEIHKAVFCKYYTIDIALRTLLYWGCDKGGGGRLCHFLLLTSGVAAAFARAIRSLVIAQTCNVFIFAYWDLTGLELPGTIGPKELVLARYHYRSALQACIDYARIRFDGQVFVWFVCIAYRSGVVVARG